MALTLSLALSLGEREQPNNGTLSTNR